MEQMTGRILQNNNGLYSVETADGVAEFRARGGVKRTKLYCGDFAIIEDGVIVGVEERKNLLIRPSVANIDLIVAVISPIPKPDFLMLDKLIINCRNLYIDLAIVINKSDLHDSSLVEYVKSNYADAVDYILETTALDGKVEEIKNIIKGKTVCLAGQSAVGKSSIINALMESNVTLTGELSKKIERGKNTTVSSRLYKLAGGYVMDTPGFGLLDAHGVTCEDLKLFYADYCGCEYVNCNHIDEPGCEVRSRAEKGLISKDRYERYKIIYSELKTKGDKYEKR